MKSREELRNDYEEALFAMIMDEIMDLEGEALIAERERLALSEEDKLSDKLNEKCIAVIHDTFEAKKEAAKKLRCRKVLRTVLVAAVVMSMLATSVCALVPEVKEKVLNFVMDITENVIHFSIRPIEKVEIIQKNYTFGYIPEEFEYQSDGCDDFSVWEIYSSKSDPTKKIIFIVCYGFDSTVAGYDNEEGTSEEITVGCYEGLLIQKEDRWQAALYDSENNNFLDIVFENVDKEVVLKMLYSIISY